MATDLRASACAGPRRPGRDAARPRSCASIISIAATSASRRSCARSAPTCGARKEARDKDRGQQADESEDRARGDRRGAATSTGMPPLTLALPRGRILDEALALFERAGIDLGAAEKRAPARLVFPIPGHDLRVLVVRDADVPTYVEHGAADSASPAATSSRSRARPLRAARPRHRPLPPRPSPSPRTAPSTRWRACTSATLHRVLVPSWLWSLIGGK